MHDTSLLRDQLVGLLRGGHAHIDFERAVAGLPAAQRGSKPAGLPHSSWRLVEHMRIAQWDILRFCVDPLHVSPSFPDGYWPRDDQPSNDESWERSVEAFRADLRTFVGLVQAQATDLFAPIPGGEGQTILREALLLADHNAYHLGQLVLVRRLLGSWEDSG